MVTKSYTVHELAELAGVSVRTLHHYDQAGLLQPDRSDNNYRKYGAKEVERLQQILLYRQAGVPLKDIKRLLDDKSFNAQNVLCSHLEQLRQQRHQIETLIASVEKTLAHMKGDFPMEDKERFEGFKKELIDTNEKNYGTEIREKYGDETVDASNAKLADMSEEQFMHAKDIEEQIKSALAEAIANNESPDSPVGQQISALHRDWICMFWKDGAYNKQAHMVLADGYVADPRFGEYYESIAPGATNFLRDAIHAFCS